MKRTIRIFVISAATMLLLSSCNLEKKVSVSTRGYETGSMTIGRSKQHVDVDMPSESDYKTTTLYKSK